jgi:MFS family permease
MQPTDSPGSPKAGGRSAERSRHSHLVAALHYPDFRVLWLCTVSNQLGQGMQQVLLGWLILDITGSGGMVGAIFAIRSAPNLLIGFAAGSVTDRLDRRFLIRVATFGEALVSLAMALLLFMDQFAVWGLLLFAFALGTQQAFYTTARQVYVYDVVGAGGAVNGIALISLAQRIGGVFGALLAGVITQWWGPDTCFLVMGLSYIVGGLALFGLRHSGQSASQSREPIWQNLRHYFTELKTNRVMLSLMVSTAAAEVLGFSHQVVLPVLAKDMLGVGAAGLGVLTAFRSVGGALGVALLATLGEVRRRGVLLLVTLGMFGGSQILLGQAPNFWMALLFVTLVNALASLADALHQTLLQLSVSNEQRGRAMGSWVVGVGTGPVGQLEVGYLAGLTSARIALLANGVALSGLALVFSVALPKLRRL